MADTRLETQGAREKPWARLSDGQRATLLYERLTSLLLAHDASDAYAVQMQTRLAWEAAHEFASAPPAPPDAELQRLRARDNTWREALGWARTDLTNVKAAIELALSDVTRTLDRLDPQGGPRSGPSGPNAGVDVRKSDTDAASHAQWRQWWFREGADFSHGLTASEASRAGWTAAQRMDDAAFDRAVWEEREAAILALSDENQRMRKFVERVAEGGIRLDLNPTLDTRKVQGSGATYEWWSEYVREADERLRNEAKAALETPGHG